MVLFCQFFLSYNPLVQPLKCPNMVMGGVKVIPAPSTEKQTTCTAWDEAGGCLGLLGAEAQEPEELPGRRNRR